LDAALRAAHARARAGFSGSWDVAVERLTIDGCDAATLVMLITAHSEKENAAGKRQGPLRYGFCRLVRVGRGPYLPEMTLARLVVDHEWGACGVVC
jgi:hypothetical protein